MAHHSREHIHLPSGIGERASDIITAFVGSWKFVFIHAVWFILWILFRLEAFPYGLLTLLVSLEAIFLSTFVMMSQNRAAQKDHLRDDHEAEEVDLLYQINQQQLEILSLLRTQLCADVPLKERAKNAAQQLVPLGTAKLAGSVQPKNKSVTAAPQKPSSRARTRSKR